MDQYEKHAALLDQMHQTYVSKNIDYGNSAGDTFKKYGLLAYVVRLNDKMNRIESLVKKQGEQPQVHTERLEDTLMDMANYCIMAIMDLTQQGVLPTKAQQNTPPKVVLNVAVDEKLLKPTPPGYRGYATGSRTADCFNVQ